MTITKDIKSNSKKLNNFVGKTIVEFLWANQANLNFSFKSSDAVNYVFKELGYTDPIFADTSLREKVNITISKIFNMLEKVEAIKVGGSMVENFEIYIKRKNSKSDVANRLKESYKIENDLNEKITILKTHEEIINADIAVFTVFNNKQNVKIVKGYSEKQIKKANELFCYEKDCDFIGYYNNKLDSVNLISAKVKPQIFYVNNAKHISPVNKNLIELYKQINLNPQIKTLFYNDGLINKKTS